MEKDIYLVVADTLTAFNLPTYGYERDTAPFLTELAEENTVFKQAYAPAPWTVPVHASMFSGEMPDVCGTHSESLTFTADSFVEDLKEEGYNTIGISNNPLVSNLLGFDRGFEYFTSQYGVYFESEEIETFSEVYDNQRKGKYNSSKEKYQEFFKKSILNKDIRSITEALKFKIRKRKGRESPFPDSGAGATNKLVERKLSESEQKSFVFLNYMETHQKFEIPEYFEDHFLGDRERDEKIYKEEIENKDPLGQDIDDEVKQVAKDMYDSTIRYLDDRMKELYHIAEENSDDFIFIFVGDHGEMLGEQDQTWGHHNGIWQELIRVPAIVAGPNIESKEITDYFTLANIRKLIQGKNPEELTQEKVFAEYRGRKNFAEEYGQGLPEDESKMRYYDNKAFSVVEGGKMKVKSTEMQSYVYKVKQLNKGEREFMKSMPKSLKYRYGLGDFNK